MLENHIPRMSSKHLIKGSGKPDKAQGKLRLYSMQFCPYAMRVRLVLLAKQIPHDIVNIHLKNKPDWYLEVNPKGEVPALDTGSQIVTESLNICDYLDEEYPDPALYPEDEAQRAHDKELIKQNVEVNIIFYKAFYELEKKSFSEFLEDFKPHLLKYECELKQRGGVFFGIDKPCMVDYMLWPWSMGAQTLKLLYNHELPGKDVYPCLYTWCEAMHKLKVVQEMEIEPERLYKLNRQMVAGPQAVDYDSI